MSDFNKVKSAIRLSDYIMRDAGIVLTAAGVDTYRGPCPLHGSSNNSSFIVNDDKGSWKCWSGDCGSGSVIDYYFATHPELDPSSGRDQAEVLRALADYAHITLEERPGSRTRHHSSSALKKAFDSFALWCHKNLVTENYPDEFDTYLDERDISDDWIDTWKIGYCPDRDASVDAALDICDGDESLAVASGILRKGEGGNGNLFCPYSNRMTIPLGDKTGKFFVGISARLVPGIHPGMGAKSKYINTHETEIYHKGELMFNHHTLYDKTATRVFVVEGSFDVMAVSETIEENPDHLSGCTVVASSGTSLTSDHVSLLKSHGKKVTYLFDGDDGGTKGFLHAAKYSLEMRYPATAIKLPPNKDCFDAFQDGNLTAILTENHPFDLIELTTSALVLQYAEDESNFASLIGPLVASSTKISDMETIISITASGYGITASAAKALVNSRARVARTYATDNDKDAEVFSPTHAALLTLADDHREIFATLAESDSHSVRSTIGLLTDHTPPEIFVDVLEYMMTSGTSDTTGELTRLASTLTTPTATSPTPITRRILASALPTLYVEAERFAQTQPPLHRAITTSLSTVKRAYREKDHHQALSLLIEIAQTITSLLDHKDAPVATPVEETDQEIPQQVNDDSKHNHHEDDIQPTYSEDYFPVDLDADESDFDNSDGDDFGDSFHSYV